MSDDKYIEYYLKSNFLILITGSKTNTKMDGSINSVRMSQGFYRHEEAIEFLINWLKEVGYDFNQINFDNSIVSGSDLLSEGHILFCNSSVYENKIGALFIPNNITEKQLTTFRIYENELKNYLLYVFQIDKDKNEIYEKYFDKNFSLDEILLNQNNVENFFQKTKK